MNKNFFGTGSLFEKARISFHIRECEQKIGARGREILILDR